VLEKPFNLDEAAEADHVQDFDGAAPVVPGLTRLALAVEGFAADPLDQCFERGGVRYLEFGLVVQLDAKGDIFPLEGDDA
jgi:hypothetical protein